VAYMFKKMGQYFHYSSNMKYYFPLLLTTLIYWLSIVDFISLYNMDIISSDGEYESIYMGIVVWIIFFAFRPKSESEARFLIVLLRHPRQWPGQIRSHMLQQVLPS